MTVADDRCIFLELKDATSDIFVRDFSFWHIPPRFFIKGYYKSMIKKYDFFVTVRNPFTRVVSEYYCAWGGPQVKASNVHDFNVWIKNKLLSIQDLVFKRLNDKAAMFGHWIPQYIYITDSSGSQIVDTANIIHLETLDDEFDSLMKRYNLPSDFTLRKKPHSLKSDKTFDVVDLNDENIQLIQNIYLNDFEMLGYDKNMQNLMPISSTITLVNTECS